MVVADLADALVEPGEALLAVGFGDGAEAEVARAPDDGDGLGVLGGDGEDVAARVGFVTGFLEGGE